MRLLCKYCGKPVHIERLAGIVNCKGDKHEIICDNICCLINFVDEQESNKKEK